MPFEGLRQVALIRKPARSCHASKRDIPLCEQTLGSLDALTQHELVRACSRGVTEQAGKVIGAEAGLLRQGLKRELLFEMSLDEVQHAAHLLRRQPP